MTERPPSPRFELVARSESGLSYVREKRGGLTRVLTQGELDDFSDPPPCPQCAEQFGCEHFNCAGEPLLGEQEVEAEVPAEWVAFARENGLSRPDLLRLASLEQSDGRYRLASGAASDMRTLELMLLLNGDDS